MFCLSPVRSGVLLSPTSIATSFEILSPTSIAFSCRFRPGVLLSPTSIATLFEIFDRRLGLLSKCLPPPVLSSVTASVLRVLHAAGLSLYRRRRFSLRPPSSGFESSASPVSASAAIVVPLFGVDRDHASARFRFESASTGSARLDFLLDRL
jgi:hypothetical protein